MSKQRAEAADLLGVDVESDLVGCLKYFFAQRALHFGLFNTLATHVRHAQSDVIFHHFQVALAALHHDCVPLAVGGLELAWAAVAHEATVDLDDEVVAKRLGLVHTMRRQHHGRIFQLLQHLEETATANGINTCRRLVQELDLRVSNKTHCAHKLSFVTTR